MCIQCSFNDLECSEVEYEKLRLIFYMNPDLISNLRERKKGRSWLKSTTRDLWWFLITETFKNCRFHLVWFWPFHRSTIQSILPFPKLLLHWLLEIPLCLSLLLRYFKYKSAQSVGYFIFYFFKNIMCVSDIYSWIFTENNKVMVENFWNYAINVVISLKICLLWDVLNWAVGITKFIVYCIHIVN